MILLRDINPIEPTAYIYLPGAAIPPLPEMQLPSRAWASRRIAGFINWTPTLNGADAVWLIAHTPSGGKCRWKVAKLRGMKKVGDIPLLSLEG
jgi:hypothetical protein